MSVIRKILEDYLYKEEVQQLARGIGLPVSRNKDEIIEELLTNPDFDPIEAIRFLRVWQLQKILRDWDLPSGAARNELFDRVATLVKEECTPPMPRPSPKAMSPPQTHEKPLTAPSENPPPALGPVSIHIHSTPLSEANDLTEGSSTAAWGFVSVVSASVFTGVFLILNSVFGTMLGVVIGVASCLTVAVVLLLTEKRWVPILNQLVRPVQSR